MGYFNNQFLFFIHWQVCHCQNSVLCPGAKSWAENFMKNLNFAYFCHFDNLGQCPCEPMIAFGSAVSQQQTRKATKGMRKWILTVWLSWWACCKLEFAFWTWCKSNNLAEHFAFTKIMSLQHELTNFNCVQFTLLLFAQSLWTCSKSLILGFVHGGNAKAGKFYTTLPSYGATWCDLVSFDVFTFCQISSCSWCSCANLFDSATGC